jgi:hypothetical protein
MTRIHPYCLRSVCVIVILLGAADLSLSAQTQSPSLFAANEIREALKKDGVLPKMTTSVRTSGEMRSLIARCLDRRILSHIKSISGRYVDYNISDSSQPLLAGVVVLEYETPTETRKMAAMIGPRGTFRVAVETPFSAVTLGSLLVITYAEGIYDPVLKALDNLDSDFAKASESGTVRWAEPGTVYTPK